MRTCSIKGCNNKHLARGFCYKHYREKHLKDWLKVYRQNRDKKYQEENREKIHAIQKKYRQTEKGKLSAKKRYKKNLNTEKGRLAKRIRVQRRNRLLRGLTVAIVQRVYEDNIKKYETLTCYLCGKPVKFGQDALEHKTPPHRGGTNDYDNLDVAHSWKSKEKCNSYKGSMTLEEYNQVKIKGGS